MKSVTPAFDRAIHGGLTFGDLMVFSDFRFDESLLFSLALQKNYAPMLRTAVHGNTPH
jgi:hypothetical protein